MVNHFKHVGIWGLFGAVMAILLVQAYNPAWRNHLQVDVATFQLRATYFLDHGSWKDLGYNEYQPGALWFFALVGYLAANAHDFESYLTALAFVNILLCAWHVYFCIKHGPPLAPYLMLLVLLASGPILFYRFELFVTLLVLYGWVYMRGKHPYKAAVLWGVAAAIKVYPVILLPLLLGQVIWQQRRMWPALSILASFAAGLVVPVGGYMLAGGTYADLTAGLQFHELKPVGLEGMWGSAILLSQQAAGEALNLTPGYGVHGFTPNNPLLSLSFLNSVWMGPYALVAVAMLYLFRRQGYDNPILFFALISVFVVCTKVLNPQYLWWYVSFLPLVAVNAFRGRVWWWVVVASILFALALTQIVYPLHYTEFLNWFDGIEINPLWWQLSIWRNVFLGIALVATLAAVSAPKRGMLNIL
jgi:hypothetical protein